eukprot:SRR837773.17364.p1 GENE.SRR837773.17364~~SRR837773.17364.p1  ORF type:complete len:149 (-),score=25.08 SRR837773.17364:22-468(-)
MADGAAGPRSEWEDWLDRVALGLLTFLEAHPSVCDLELQHRPGMTRVQLQEWEAENRPHVLPDDLKEFFAVCNGLTLQWKLKFRGRQTPFGLLHVNPVEKLLPLPAPPPTCGHPATDQSIERGLSMSISVRTRKMVNYACEGQTQRKL